MGLMAFSTVDGGVVSLNFIRRTGVKFKSNGRACSCVVVVEVAVLAGVGTVLLLVAAGTDPSCTE